jgi:hypothetical protein
MQKTLDHLPRTSTLFFLYCQWWQKLKGAMKLSDATGRTQVFL